MIFFKKVKIRKVAGNSMYPSIVNNSIAMFFAKKNYQKDEIVLLTINGKEYIKKINDINNNGKYSFISEDFYGLDSRVWGYLDRDVIMAKYIFSAKPMLVKNSFKKILQAIQ